MNFTNLIETNFHANADLKNLVSLTRQVTQILKKYFDKFKKKKIFFFFMRIL